MLLSARRAGLPWCLAPRLESQHVTCTWWWPHDRLAGARRRWVSLVTLFWAARPHVGVAARDLHMVVSL